MLDLVSIHVPKCGGMTVRSHLLNFFGAADVLLDYGGAPRSGVLHASHSKRKWCSPHKTRCIHGVFNPRKLETFKTRVLATCLRDPVKRLLSQYWYWMHLENTDNPMVEKVRRGEVSLLDLAWDQETRGLYSRVLFGGVDMMTFDVIGDTDELGDYLDRLGRCLGTTFKSIRINESPEPAYQGRVAETMADANLMKQLRCALAEDIRFYERYAGRSGIGKLEASAAYRVREANRADVMLRHPRASEIWPHRFRPAEQTAAEEEVEKQFHQKHARQAPLSERINRGEVTDTGFSSRDFAVGPEIDLVLADGLSPDARVLDIGAGTLRVAHELALKLAPHHYFAVEPNARLVEWGRQALVQVHDLDARVPASNIVVDATFNFQWAMEPFDVAIASFVFDQLPLAALEACLAGLGPVMKDGGHFYLTYCPLPEGADFDDQLLYADGSVSWPDRAPFHYRLADLAAAAQRHGWTLEASMPLSNLLRCHHEQARLRYGKGGAAQVPIPKPASKPVAAGIKYWWQSPEVWQHVNSMLGDTSPRPSAGFHKLIAECAGDPIERGLSMAASDGRQELRLMLTGAVEHFDLWSSSEAMISAGKVEAERFGLSDRVTWKLGHGLTGAKGGDYGLVYWNHSLHMEPDVDVAIAGSIDRLRNGGVFAADGYVGPSRFQYDDVALEAVAHFRKTLPIRLLASVDGTVLPVRPQRVPLDRMIALSPHLAPDSGRILDIVRARLPGATIRFAGGCLYQIGLDGVLVNLDLERDIWVLKEALLLDRVLCDLGHSLFASVVGQKMVQNGSVET